MTIPQTTTTLSSLSVMISNSSLTIDIGYLLNSRSEHQGDHANETQCPNEKTLFSKTPLEFVRFGLSLVLESILYLLDPL